MEMALEVKGLCKEYASFTMKNLDFSLPKGYIMGFIGANGRGKSTTIKLILNLAKRSAGQIKICGIDNQKMTAEQKEMVAYVPDGNCLPENLTWPEVDRIMKNCYSTWDSEKFAKMCAGCSLDKKAKISDYSKGMKMKLSIAVALSHDSRLLIMDEPTSGLDPLARDELRDLLTDYVLSGDRSVLLSSHITSDLEKICDYITFIKDGRLIASGEKDALMEKYALLNCTKQRLEEIDPRAVVSVRHGSFGEQALVIREKLPVGKAYSLDPATLEDIMIYYNREEK